MLSDAELSEIGNMLVSVPTLMDSALHLSAKIETISEHFYISRTQLYRKVKALTNESVVVFIQKIQAISKKF